MALWLCFSVFNFFSQPVLWNVEEMGWSLEAILQFRIVFNIMLYLLSYSSKFYFLCAVRNYFKAVVFLRRLYLNLGKQIFSVHKMRMCFICIYSVAHRSCAYTSGIEGFSKAINISLFL